MKTLDELLADKIIDLVNYGLSKIIKPDIEVEKVTDLDAKMIDELKEKYGIEGVILDVDETLRKDKKRIPKCNEDWIELLRGKLKVVIVSNGFDRNLERIFDEKKINYIMFAHKPLKMNFIKACKLMDLPPDKVLTVGDSLLDDIHGGHRLNMRTALVRDVCDGGNVSTRSNLKDEEER